VPEITLITAFLAGLASFASPCFLPLVPAFVSYLSGVSFGEGMKMEWARRKVFLNTLFFVLGFVVVFSALGVAANGILLGVSSQLMPILEKIGGIVIVFFGLFTLGAVKLDFLQKEHRIKPAKTRYAYITSFLLGATFAVSWTPCAGAMLITIFSLAVVQPGSSFALLFMYSCGLAVPFLITGAFTAQVSDFIKRHERKLALFNKVMGVVLIVIGILVFTGNLTNFSSLALATKCLSS
jgi:cytochrome c-type biogenesis protein